MLRAPTEPFVISHVFVGVLAPLACHQPRFRMVRSSHCPRRQIMLTVSVRRSSMCTSMSTTDMVP